MDGCVNAMKGQIDAEDDVNVRVIAQNSYTSDDSYNSLSIHLTLLYSISRHWEPGRDREANTEGGLIGQFVADAVVADGS